MNAARTTSLAAALLAAVSVPAAAELSGRTAELQFFEGEWTCAGRRFATPQMPEHTFRATYEFAPVGGGAWMTARFVELPDPSNPNPIIVEEHWGYDASSDAFRNQWVSNFSTSGAFVAPGWDEAEWVWSTDSFPIGDQAVPMRVAFARDGDNRFDVTPTLDLAEGSAQPFAFSCDRRE